MGSVTVAVGSVTVGANLGGLAVAVVVSLGVGRAVGGGLVDVTVLAPSLSAVLVGVIVVPFVVGLG